MAAAGKGRSEGQVFTVTVTWLRCANGSPGAIPTPSDLTFVATADGHLDFGGVIFSRIGSRGALRSPLISAAVRGSAKSEPRAVVKAGLSA
jgi:hypothetical protein